MPRWGLPRGMGGLPRGVCLVGSAQGSLHRVGGLPGGYTHGGLPRGSAGGLPRESAEGLHRGSAWGRGLPGGSAQGVCLGVVYPTSSLL